MRLLSKLLYWYSRTTALLGALFTFGFLHHRPAASPFDATSRQVRWVSPKWGMSDSFLPPPLPSSAFLRRKAGITERVFIATWGRRVVVRQHEFLHLRRTQDSWVVLFYRIVGPLIEMTFDSLEMCELCEMSSVKILAQIEVILTASDQTWR